MGIYREYYQAKRGESRPVPAKGIDPSENNPKASQFGRETEELAGLHLISRLDYDPRLT